MRLIAFSLFCAGLLACSVTLLGDFGQHRPLISDLVTQSQTLSPQVKGKLALGGSELVNVEITRTLSVGDQQFVSRAKTDSSGHFYFAPMTTEHPVFGEPPERLWQDISVRYQGQQYVLWYTAIDHELDNFVLQETLSQLQCNLLSAENEFNISDKRRPSLPVNVYSICDLHVQKSAQKKAAVISG